MKNSFISVLAGVFVFGVIAFIFFSFFSGKVPALPRSQVTIAETSELGFPVKASKPKASPALPNPTPIQVTKPVLAQSKLMAQDEEIRKVRIELQKVLDINKRISQIQASRTKLLLHMDNKTRVQQKVLEGVQNFGIQTKVMPARETLLAQERLRLIRDETLHNKKALDDSHSIKVG